MKKRYGTLRLISKLLKITALLYLSFNFFWSFDLFTTFVWDRANLITSIRNLLTQIFTYVLITLIVWAISEWIKLQIDAQETSRATAILLRQLLEEKSPGSTRPASVNGMWDDNEPASDEVKRPVIKVKTKAVGGYDRWEANDLVQVRLRQGSLKNRKTSLPR